MAESHFPRPPLAEIKVFASDERAGATAVARRISPSPADHYTKEMERR